MLDGWGGVHTFGGAPPVGIGGYWNGHDVARALWAGPLPATAPGGYEVNADGTLSPFGSVSTKPAAPPLVSSSSHLVAASAT